MPSPLLLVSIALALSLLGNVGLGKLYLGKRDELAAEKQAFASFKAQQKVLGDAAQKKADDQKAADEKRKKDADEENVKAIAALNADIERLRRDRIRTRPNILPAAPTGSKCPAEQACFDRAELERTLRDYRQEIRGLVDEGSSVTTDLNTAKKWAQGNSVR